MKKWLENMMKGRYGVDQLSLALMVLSLLGSISLSLLTEGFIRYLPYIFLILCFARILSKNFSKRYNENRIYMNVVGPPLDSIRLFFKHLKQRRTHKFVKCPHCKQKLRIPRKKGKIEITCPKCHNSFEGRS